MTNFRYCHDFFSFFQWDVFFPLTWNWFFFSVWWFTWENSQSTLVKRNVVKYKFHLIILVLFLLLLWVTQSHIQITCKCFVGTCSAIGCFLRQFAQLIEKARTLFSAENLVQSYTARKLMWNKQFKSASCFQYSNSKEHLNHLLLHLLFDNHNTSLLFQIVWNNARQRKHCLW